MSITSNKIEAFKDVQIVYMMGATNHPDNPEFKIDVFQNRLKPYKKQAQILNKYANKHVKVIVCNRPINTNCLVMAKYAPDIPVQSFTGVARLDNNRAQAQVMFCL